jgi:DnaD/phage-associated family protein
VPNRLIKESIKRSPEIDKLSWFEEVVFYRLIVTADDYGRLDGRPVVLLHDLFPTKETITRKAIEDALSKLTSVGLLVPYADAASGMPYYYLPTWKEHQRVRDSKARYPEPPAGNNLAATRGNSPQLAATCGENPLARAESESNPNPIQNESESETRTREENPFGDGGGEDRPDFNTVEAYVANNIPGMNYANMQEMASFKDDLPEDVIRYAVDKACERNIRNWGYVKGILNKIIAAGLHTLAEVKEHDARFAQGGKAAKAAQNNPALNYEQRDYSAQDDDELYTDMDYYAETGIVKSIAEVRRMRERGEIK